MKHIKEIIKQEYWNLNKQEKKNKLSKSIGKQLIEKNN